MQYINKSPLIFCIGGKARSGKTLVGEIIANHYQNLNKKIIFSPYTKYLKKYISEITGWNMSDKDKPRDMLQDISKDLIKERLGYKDIFINRQIEDIDIYSYFFDVIIISDIRFPNEITKLKEKYENVISIKVERDNYQSELTKKQLSDTTETSLDNYNEFDYIIKNNNNDNLYSDVKKIINNIEMRNNNE